MADIKFHSPCQRACSCVYPIRSWKKSYKRCVGCKGTCEFSAFTLWPQAILLTFTGASFNVGQTYVTFFSRRMYEKNKRSQFGCCTYSGSYRSFWVLFVACLFELFAVWDGLEFLPSNYVALIRINDSNPYWLIVCLDQKRWLRLSTKVRKIRSCSLFEPAL